MNDPSSMDTTSSGTTSAAPTDAVPAATAAPQQSLPPPHPSTSIPSTPELTPPTTTTASAIPNQNPQQQQQQQQTPPTNVAPKQQNHHHHIQQQQHLQQPTIFQHTQQRPALNRPRPLQSPYSHFSPHLPPTSTSAASGSSLSSPVSSSHPVTTMQRGGVAVGVPAPHVRPPQQHPAGSFSTFGTGSFNQFGGLGRGPVNVTETMPNPTMQVRQPPPGVQSMGMMSPFGSGSQLRPSGAPALHQQRPGPPSRTQSQPNNQALATQKFQSHNMAMVSSLGTPNSQSPMASQGSQTHPQSWVSGQGKQTHTQTLPSPSYKPPMKTPGMNQRSHLPQQHQQATPSTSHQQQMPSIQQQQPLPQTHQSQEHYNQQYSSPRLPQSMPHQPQVTRPPGSAAQKSLVPAAAQSSMPQAVSHAPAVSNDTPDDGPHILSKRSIQELVTQIDPSEKLNPEVEDVLVEIAEDFVESITTFACSLAKHRKSTALEAKDILLHLERNWSMTLPGFGGDEIKCYKKQFTNDVHRERLAAIKKSIVGTEGTNLKSSTAQTAANVKGHTAKPPPTGPEKT